MCYRVEEGWNPGDVDGRGQLHAALGGLEAHQHPAALPSA